MTRRNGLGLATMWIAASALVLAGCGGGGNGLYVDGMFRIAALEEATMMTRETAASATTDAATAREEAHAADAMAAAAQVEAEAAATRAMEARVAAAATGRRAQMAEEAIEELQAQLDRQADADSQYDPDDPGGTLEGAAGREAAARLAAAAAAAGAWPGASYPTAAGRLFDRAAIDALQGSAFYRGPATGRYAVRAQAGHEATSGRFRATAIIRATFYAGGLDITGSRIDHFMDRVGAMDEDSAMDMSDWVVNLLGANVAAAGTVSGDTTALTDGRLSYGVWQARFRGDNQQIHPTGIVGRFKAVGGTARPVLTPEGRIDQFLDSGLGVVIGSFGASQ